MCTILIAWRAVPGASLLIAANRDEMRDRRSEPPQVLSPGPPPVVGGRDLLAGGTWLALAADGRVAAVTNRHTGPRDPARRSRGELPGVLLADADPVARLDALIAAAYNPANVLYATGDVVVVRHLLEGREGPAWLGPGTHVLTTDDVDDAASPKVRHLGGRLAAAVDAASAPLEALAAMEDILADHGAGDGRGLDAACVHLDGYGTVSTSSVAVLDGGEIVYRYGEGSACTARRVDVSALLWPAGG